MAAFAEGYTIGRMFFLDARAARVTWTVIVFAAGLRLVYLLRKPLLLFVFSLFFAYLIFPVVRVVERGLPRRGGRALAIGVVYLMLLLALVGVGLGVGPRLTDEVTLLTQKAPEMSQRIGSGQIITDLLRKRGWEAARLGQVEGAVRAHAGQIIGYVQGAVAAGLRWLAGAWVIVLVPVFAFFILKDGEPAAAGIDGLIEEPRHRELWRDIAEDVHLLLAKYVRALILLSLITFFVWSAAFFVAGVPYPVGLAAIGGALEFLPIVGPLTAGVIVVGVALFSGYAHPWLLVAFVLVWRGIQDYVSSPLVMGRGIEIHPAVVIFGVIAGGEIGGPAGMFLSVPVLAALRIVWRRVRDARSGAAHAPVGESPGITGPEVSAVRGWNEQG
jgi:predicted PurR-regulated permease PerM